MDDSGEKGEKVTNLDYLVKLSKGNEQFVKEMIRIFLEENPGEITTLEKAIKEQDYSLINMAAHKLRSTIPFVGIDKIIASEISEIEQLALNKAGNPLMQDAPEQKKPGFLPTDRELIKTIEKLFTKIKNICWKACDELRTYST
jgi:HPt (histidine-containing phosphotransfer) domain-containing protein